MASVNDNREKEEVWSLPSDAHAPEEDNGIIIGIDLGTSNTVCAVWHPGKSRAKIIKVNERRVTPSTVTWGASWEDCTVGNASPIAIAIPSSSSSGLPAGEGGSRNTGSSDVHDAVSHVSGAKLVMGQTCEDVQRMLTADAASPLSRNVHMNSAGPTFICQPAGLGSEHQREVSPEEVCSEVLKAVRQAAEKYLFVEKPIFSAIKAGRALLAHGENLKCFEKESNRRGGSDGKYALLRVVIGVPATYAAPQRTAVRRAATLAGFTDVHLCVESTAAAVAYGLGVAGSKHVMTIDIGGGTSDITIMRITDDITSTAGCTFQVVTSAGAARCGGLDMDALLLQYALRKAFGRALTSTIPEIEAQVEELLISLPVSQVQALLVNARAVRELLTTSAVATLRVPMAAAPAPAPAPAAAAEQEGEVDAASRGGVDVQLSRTDLEEAVMPGTHLLCLCHPVCFLRCVYACPLSHMSEVLCALRPVFCVLYTNLPRRRLCLCLQLHSGCLPWFALW